MAPGLSGVNVQDFPDVLCEVYTNFAFRIFVFIAPVGNRRQVLGCQDLYNTKTPGLSGVVVVPVIREPIANSLLALLGLLGLSGEQLGPSRSQRSS